MTYLNMNRLVGNKNKKPYTNNEDNRPREHASAFRRDDQGRQRGMGRSHDTNVSSSPENATEIEIERMIAEGRQVDLVEFFEKWREVPKRIGEWDIRVNIRRLDNEPVSRTIVALPLTVRARGIFKKGCLVVLAKAGFSEEDAGFYFKRAWKKKYVWIDSVIAATKEMIDAFQNTSVLESYEAAGDPRRIASTVKVPANPYLCSHAQFLVAVDMAKCVIKDRNDRQADVVVEQKVDAIVKQEMVALDIPRIESSEMVPA